MASPEPRSFDSSDATLTDAPAEVIRHERFFELRSSLSGRRTVVLGIIGAAAFFGAWELGHLLTPDESKRFLPSPREVIATLWRLLVEKNFLRDIGISVTRIFVSFFAACAVAAPLEIGRAHV